MGRIPEETIQQVRDRVDIVDLVGRYVSLKRSGVNNFGLCPFHNENSPSFNVNSARQIFHCFGCGEGGNAISFLMKIEGLGFRDALRKLAAEAGIEIEEERLTPEQEEARRKNEQLRHVNDLACSFYKQLLLEDPAGAPARRYLRSRGYDGEAARAFQLGYAPEGWENLALYLKQAKIDAELPRRLGLVRPGKQGRGDYDLFRGRLIFPIFDHYGQVVAFGGRVLAGDGPKYINSPESPIYHKSRVLYGLYRAKEAMRRSDTAIVVEGYFDVLAMHRAGITQTVATCGTALTADHVRMLKRYAQRLVLLFDQDQAGQAAALRAMEVALPEGLDVQVVSLASGEDPDSFLASAGRDAFEERLGQARSALEWLMANLLKGDSGIAEQARAVDEVLRYVGLLPGEIERSLSVKRLAERTGLAEEILQRKLAGQRKLRPRTVVGPEPGAGRGDTCPPPTEAPWPQEPEDYAASASSVDRPSPGGGQGPREVERLLLQLVLEERAFLPQVEAFAASDGLLHPDIRALLAAVRGVGDAGAETLRDNADLSTQQKEILSGILERDPAMLGESREETFASCIRELQRRDLDRRIKQLRRQIAELERAGEHARLAELNRELTELGQRLKGGAEET